MDLLWEGAIPMAHGLQIVDGRKGTVKAEVILGYGIGKVNNV